MDTWEAITAAGAALAGLVLGGWVVAAIAWLPGYPPGLRVPGWRDPVSGRRLRLADLVPVTGWHHTGATPETASLAAGAGTAVVLALMAIRFGPSPVLAPFCLLGLVGVPLAVIDARYQRLPDALTLPAYPIAAALLGVAALTTPDGGRRFLIALAGLGAALVLFGVQVLVYPAGVGLGDLKLAGLLGLYLGWLGAAALLGALLLSYVLAAVTAIALLATRRATRRARVPFGPYLLAATLIVILAGLL
jgi:leader peptidase (prepilin peptidase)/N-methyltransferase